MFPVMCDASLLIGIVGIAAVELAQLSWHHRTSIKYVKMAAINKPLGQLSERPVIRLGLRGGWKADFAQLISEGTSVV